MIVSVLTSATVGTEECGGQQLKWPTLRLQGHKLLVGGGMSARLDQAQALTEPVRRSNSHLR